MVSILPEDRIDTMVRRFQTVYLVLSLLGLFYVCGLIIGWGDKPPREELESLIMVLFIGATYLGLRFRAPWVVHMILICSAFGVMRTFLFLFEYTPDLFALVLKTIGLLNGLLCAYQIFFFQKERLRYSLKTRE